METLGSSTTGSGSNTPASEMGDGSRPPTEAFAPAGGNSTSDGDGSVTMIPELYQLLGYPDDDSFFEALRKEAFEDYVQHFAPRLRPIAAVDSVKRFLFLCGAWPQYMCIRGLIVPEIFISLVCHNALACTRAMLQRTAPELRRYKLDIDARHQYGFAPLHVAAEAFNVDMVRLLLRHGASGNVRTKGTKVIEGLLPLHVAVENAAMHKYLEDHWAYGDPVENLIILLCLPEMKMYLDTTRLIAKHTDNIVDEIWSYIEKEKLVPASILLLAAQKQLRGRSVNTSSGKVFKSGFDDVTSRTVTALVALHHEELAMTKEGKNGRALKLLKHKTKVLLTVNAIVGTVNVAGEDLEKYIQTNSEVPHEEIVGHVSSILNTNGIVTYGKGIDTANLNCYQYPWQQSIDKPSLQRGRVNEADKSSSLKAEGSQRVKASLNGESMDHARNKFFPFWKSVLSSRLEIRIAPPCQPSNKDTRTTQPSKDTASTEQSSEKPGPAVPQGFANAFGLFRRNPPPRDYQSKRSYGTLASMTLKALRRA